ncbi:MAG: protoheme IX farnesyltransferase [Deltaproteobacteria bacterium]|nr:protoheme IX farnesyltransferase [Deltaproteobacteria bacterium]
MTSVAVADRSPPSFEPGAAAGVAAGAPGARASSSTRVLADVVSLGKPRIAAMAAVVGAGTFCLSTPSFAAAAVARGAVGLLGVVLLVMGAGALNMWVERDVDALMVRTRDRPLAARRLSPLVAWLVGVGLVVASLPLLRVGGNDLTCGLGLFSLFLYVLVYTPMKRTSPWSLVVGAVPGAMPALMGGTLAAGVVERAGAAMFGLVFLWQLPHFLAISLYRQDEYRAAGHRLFSTALGMRTTQLWIVGTAAPLALFGVALWPLALGGVVTGVTAVVVGLWFLAVCVGGLRLRARADVDAWARRVFFGTLIWQTVVFGALAADRLLVVAARHAG